MHGLVPLLVATKEPLPASDGSNSQKIGRVENGGHQPLRGMTAEDFDPLEGDGVARGLSIGPRFFLEVVMPGWWWNAMGLVLGTGLGMSLAAFTEYFA